MLSVIFALILRRATKLCTVDFLACCLIFVKNQIRDNRNIQTSVNEARIPCLILKSMFHYTYQLALGRVI